MGRSRSGRVEAAPLEAVDKVGRTWPLALAEAKSDNERDMVAGEDRSPPDEERECWCWGGALSSERELAGE